jgi:hypothetical protein
MDQLDMAAFVRRDRLKDLTTADWRAIERVTTEPGTSEISLAFHSVKASIAPEKLLAFLLCLEADGHGTLWTALYHDCVGHPIMILPFRTYSFPLRCPECEGDLRRSDIRTDVKFRLDKTIELTVG